MKIAIYGQYFKVEDKPYIEELITVLQERKIEFSVEENYFNEIKKHVSVNAVNTFSSYQDLDNSYNFMFTVGGDGTILRAVTFIRDRNISIVGINTGRLGFLATVQKEEISNAVELIMQKKYIIIKRSLLSVSTTPTIQSLSTFNFALNEVSVSRKNTASMITIKTFLNEEYLTSYWADGLIIATPTGSTGYSLSCGGPIITPAAKNFTLTPIAPHNLGARPIVIPDDTKIKFTVSGREDEFFLSLDSRITTINSSTEICVKKAIFNLKMVELKQQTFLKTLREKLLWGQDNRN